MSYLRLVILGVVFLLYGCSQSNRVECPIDLVLDAVQVDKIKAYEGCRAVIKGNVKNVYHSKNAHYLNFGEDYKKSFSIVFFYSSATKAGVQATDIDYIKGEDIQVSGIIRTYRPDWSFSSKPQIVINDFRDIILNKKIENMSLSQVKSSSDSFSAMLLASAKELKTNSSVLCDFIKSGKTYDQLDKDNGIQFHSTFNIVRSKGDIFFESAYGEDKNMMPMLEGLEINSNNGRLYMDEVPFYGKIRNAQDLLYLSDLYYWYSIPLYNKYLDKDNINGLHIEKDIESFNQPCNSYLYKIDKEWDEQWDFSKEKNPEYNRYVSFLGRLD